MEKIQKEKLVQELREIIFLHIKNLFLISGKKITDEEVFNLLSNIILEETQKRMKLEI